VSKALERLQQEGATVLVLTPREDEVPDAVTHVLLLDRGRVVASGPRDVVLADSGFGRLMRPNGRDGGRAAAPTTRAARAPASEPAAVVELRGVDLGYGRTRILRGIDWTVQRGERWALIGPNGAGKSALLSLILTDNPQAYANDVSLFGRRRGTGDTIWEIRRRIGSVSPETHLYYRPHHRVLDVIASGFDNSVGVRRRPSRGELEVAEACLAALGLEPCHERRFGELSEGERQVVLITRALAKRPELLVLDEPCQGLDARHRARFLDLLDRELRETETTLIYVTHDLEEVPSAVTHGLLLRDGRSAVEGSAEEVFRAYLGAPDGPAGSPR
jgi:molybdate transport system ATP-binding protein